MSTESLIPIPLRPVPAIRRAPSAIVLEAPRRATAAILGKLAPMFLSGKRLYVVDGGNCFDPYVFAREARRWGLREDVLDRVFVTRCFTIHQLAAVTRQMLPPLLQGSSPPAFAVLGLEHLFLEESLRATERARVLGGVLADLEMPRRRGAPLLVTHERVPPGQTWWRQMLEFGDARMRALCEGDDWNFRIERCTDGADAAYLQYLASGGDRLLEGFSPGPQGGAASGV